MREFTLPFNEVFQNGLRPEFRIKRGQPFLEVAKNVICRDIGVEGFEPFNDPFEGDILVGFPFPQIYRGEFETLLLDHNGIAKVNEGTFPWSRDFYQLGSFIPEGGVWHIMDMQSVWYLFNGSCVVTNLLEGNLTVNTTVPINSGINFRGRAVVGGIRAADVWTGDWENIFYFWREQNEHLPDEVKNKPGKSYVMWGTIGGGDFPAWLFKPEILSSGHVDYDDSYELIEEGFLMNQLKMNQFGFMPMPFQGDVLCVKELGKGVMVYGEDGIVYMPHFDGRTVGNEQIPPTFGVEFVTSVGVLGRGAVGGDKSIHLFIDTEGVLWSIDAELNLNRIGYKEFLFSMTESDDHVISLNPQRGEFYITDGNDCYVLAQGLSEVHQQPTSLHYVQGGLVGLFKDTEDREMLLVTNPFDMGIRGVKTIVNINTAAFSLQDLQVALDVRYNSQDAFQRTDFKRLNKEGVTWLRAHGLEFRLVIRCFSYEDIEIDYINVRWQADDKRNVRGLGVIQDTTGTDS